MRRHVMYICYAEDDVQESEVWASTPAEAERMTRRNLALPAHVTIYRGF